MASWRQLVFFRLWMNPCTQTHTPHIDSSTLIQEKRGLVSGTSSLVFLFYPDFNKATCFVVTCGSNGPSGGQTTKLGNQITSFFSVIKNELFCHCKSERKKKNLNPACEYLFSFASPDSVENQPSPPLLCESFPLIFPVWGALKPVWKGMGKSDITPLRQIPCERKKTVAAYAILSEAHYKVIGSH